MLRAGTALVLLGFLLASPPARAGEADILIADWRIETRCFYRDHWWGRATTEDGAAAEVRKDETVVQWRRQSGIGRWAEDEPGSPVMGDVAVDRLFRALTDPKRKAPLAEPLTTGQGRWRRASWHSPAEVHALAVLHERFPRLRDRSRLREVLDFWVEAMERDPDPTGRRWKASYAPMCPPYSRALAVAALLRGAAIFGDERYRADAAARLAWACYREAPFRHRIGLLAVMLGVPAFADVP